MVFSNDCNLLQNEQIAIIFSNCGHILLFSIRTNNSKLSSVASFYQLWCPFTHKFLNKITSNSLIVNSLWFLQNFKHPTKSPFFNCFHPSEHTRKKKPIPLDIICKVKNSLFGSDVKYEIYINLQKQLTTVTLQMHTCLIVARLSCKYITNTLGGRG